MTQADLSNPSLFLMIITTKGLTAPANVFWNDEYNFSEAGTPNSDERGVAGPNSSFQTTGTQSVYQLDTVRGGAVPEPSSLLLAAAAAGGTSLGTRPRLGGTR